MLLSTIFFSALLVVSRALPLQSREFKVATTFSPLTFASASWSGDDDATSGVRVYYPVNGTIQELKLTDATSETAFTFGAVLKPSGLPVTQDSPMTAANSDAEVRVFYYDTNGTLREQIWDGAAWSEGTLGVPVGAWGAKLSATSWKEDDGTVGWSVWYVQADGGLYEATKTGDAEWTINTVGHSEGPGGLFGRVWRENGRLLKRVYFQNNLIDYQLHESTWNVKTGDVQPQDAWSLDAVDGFPLKVYKAMSFCGVYVASTGAEHVFANPPTATALWEFSRHLPQATFWAEKEIDTTVKTRTLSAMSATTHTVGGVDKIWLFYTGLDGRLSFISREASKAWSPADSYRLVSVA